MGKSNLNTHIKSVIDSSNLMLTRMQEMGNLTDDFKLASMKMEDSDCKRIDIRKMLTHVKSDLVFKKEDDNFNLDILCNEETCITSYYEGLYHVFHKLMMNSIVHSNNNEEKLEIKPKVKEEDQKIYIEYNDNGPGLPDEVSNNLFDPFTTTVRHKGHHGLGLHIVYNLMNYTLGGHIEHLESIKGCKYIIEFPKIICKENRAE